MLTPERAMDVARDVMVMLVGGIENGAVKPTSDSSEMYKFVMKAAVNDEGGESPAQAVLWLAVLEDAEMAEDLERVIHKV